MAALVKFRPGTSRQIIYDSETNSVTGFRITLIITGATDSADADAAVAAWVPPANMFVVPVIGFDTGTGKITFTPTDIADCVTPIGNIRLTLKATTGCDPLTGDIFRTYQATVLFVVTAGYSTGF